MSDDEGFTPDPSVLADILAKMLGRTPGDDNPGTDVEVVVIGGADGFAEPALPKYQTDEEREHAEHEATHMAIHSLVDIRLVAQEIAEAVEADNTPAYDQANAKMHDIVGRLGKNRLRNALMIAVEMIDTDMLGRAVLEYCGKSLKEKDDE